VIRILRFSVFWAALLTLLGSTAFAYFAQRTRENAHELMRIALEDMSTRAHFLSENVKHVRHDNDAAALAKTRAFARLIASDPTILKDQSRLDAMAKTLDVDELHVSDEEGVLRSCVPADRAGLDMRLYAQTREFMPALTNKTFELAQDPRPMYTMMKSDSHRLFQFVGVARQDRPGIVQIGQRATRVEQSLALADVKELARAIRIGRYGHMSVRSSAGLPPPQQGFRTGIDADGKYIIALEGDSAGYRIFISMPDTYRFLGHPWTFRALCGLCLLCLVVGIALLPQLRRFLTHDLQSIRSLFASTGGNALARSVRSPVSIVCSVVFAVAIAACWGVSARVARINAEEMLKTAAQDMRKTFEDCVDLLLFYQGDAICKHYKSPENMSSEAVQDVMRRYGLDELNVVNADGRIVIGALADVGYDMGSKPQTAAFNCLLHGAKTYSQPFRGAVEDPTIRRKYAGVAFPPPAKGYLEIGFAEERLKDDIDYWFEDQAVDVHVGETGFFIIAKDETGGIDSCGFQDADGRAACEKGATLAGIGFDATSAPKDPNEFFVANLFGQDCLCLTEVKSYHRIVTALPLAEVHGSSKRVVLMTALVLLGVLVLVVVFMTRLSDLVTKLRGFIAAEKDRQLKDLTLAKTIQTSSLPVDAPEESDFKLFAKMVTAREVGGDFYDYYPRPDGKLVFLVADVSGKGIPAALFMMRAKAIIRAAVFERPDSISTAVRIANDNLAEHNEAEMFVTAWVGVLDRTTGEIAYVNAGHNPPLIKRADGSVEWVRGKGGIVLAAMDGVPYKSGRCKLGKGDSIFLYTDGVTEAMNTAHEQYGEARLEARLAKAGCNFVTEIGEDVAAFTVGAEQSDDITMLALDRLG